MRHVPIFIDLCGRRALVVGGTEAAARKAELLCQAGACVDVVTPGAGHRMRALAGRITLIERAFLAGDVTGSALVIVDTGRRSLDADVAAAVRAAGIPVNVIDAPALSTFIMPAIVDRDPLTVAISSGATAPVLARAVRERIEAMLPSNLGRLAAFAERFRTAVRAVTEDGQARRRFWERVFHGPIAATVLAGDERRANDMMLAAVNAPSHTGDRAGFVAIVGAGPGDADLLTLKAARALQEADVIVHDRLVDPGILDRARRDAERIYVGKARGSHALSQQEINELLVAKARAGLRVVRLKGGDPFVFGRGGEERAYLQAHGIAVEVVPGITAALGCAAAAGIPLTHRTAAQAATFVTGYGSEGEPDLDWPALARGNQTLVVYMGYAAAGRIMIRLLAQGAGPATPAAAIANGTLPGQRVIAGPLASLDRMAREAGEGGAPVLLVVGEVVRHADAWQEYERAAFRPAFAAAG
jgi:uroporphyrin-III C-methyltransferase/precorrin-2 dehydrogenase/sirohydrochlorin ferrochelatase